VAITAADVKKLREHTGAGMMDCKKALEEADGDFDKATELLRIKLGKKAAERGAERTASAGMVATSGTALVELNCETDFVAKGDDFVNTAQQIADAAAVALTSSGPADAEALRAVKIGDQTVDELVKALGLHAPSRLRPAARRGRTGGVRRLRRGRRSWRRHAGGRHASEVPHP